MMGLPDFTASQLTTIKNTVAADTNDLEFDLFMNAARSYALDPFRKQISAIVFNKKNAEKRRMAIIVGRDGLRAIAARGGDYRAASERPQVEYDDSLKGPSNPKGIVSVSVQLWKQDKRGDWFPVYGEAYWDEFAPTKERWDYNPETGKREPTGDFEVDHTWAKMPIVMLTKCAEGQALRAGWPDQFGGLYSEEEVQHHTMQDVTPSEAVQQEATHRRQNMLGNKALMMVFDDTGTLQRVPLGEVADRCVEFINSNDAEAVYLWNVRNKESLREFWAESPNDALEIKKQIEAKTEKVGQAA